MNLTAWAQAHRRSILFLMAVLAASGILATFYLPVTLFPEVAFPRVAVTMDAGDRPAEQMEAQVTIPVEEAVRHVPGVLDVRSTTSRGSAEFSITFAWGTDMPAAASHVDEAVTQILPQLPTGTRLQTRRMDPTVFPIMAYSLTSTTQSQTQLYDLARYQLRPLLSGIDGVARVGITGGAPEEYRASVDPARLAAYNLTLHDVARALTNSNVYSAVGRLEDHYKLYLAVADSRLRTLDDIRQVVVRTGGDGVVMLSDIATVTDAAVPQWIRVTADGKQAVLLNIYQQPGSNSVRMAKEVRAKLASYRSQLLPGTEVKGWYDQSDLVTESAVSVRDAIFIGIGLAAVVLFVFLRNLKITAIAVIIVPAVLASTVVLLRVLDMSFNIMTLGGMAAAVGLIIDDAIVMLEHIIRRLRGSDADHHGRVMTAAAEFLRPLSGSSASTVIIFLPLAFLSGVTGAFFKALSLTMASALVISFLLTWLALPLIADHLLNEKDASQEEGGKLTVWLHRRYEALLTRLLATPWLLLLVVLPVLLLGYVAYQRVGSGFMPAMDEGGFILDYRSPPGTSLTETDRLLQQVEAILRATPEVATYSRRTGTQLGGGLTEANQGDFFVRLKSNRRRGIEEVMDEVRTQVEQTVPGLEIELAQLMEDEIGDLTEVPQPVEVKLFDDQPIALYATARRIADTLAKIPGVVDVKDGINPAGDALEIRVDRVKAALEGLDPDSVSTGLANALAGNVATGIQQQQKTIGVRVWIPQGDRATDRDVGRLLLRAPDGHTVPVGRIAHITSISGQPEISRENLKRMVAVTARISGRDLGSAIRDVKARLQAKNALPTGMYYELGGLYRQQRIAFQGLLLVFGAAVVLVFLLLLYLYERFLVALSILAVPLLATSAVFVGLWLTGIELNITALMGMTMIIGIVTEVAIFYFSEYQALANSGMAPQRALIEAGKNRMRPIAMTTVATILTLLPLALSLGRGAAMQQPLAVAIISGLILQLPLTLLFMPALFHQLEKWRRPAR